jgi:hypothetical protein
VSFTPTASGTRTFRVRTLDQSGAVSANTATATVAVAAGEQIAITQFDNILSSSRIRLVGTIAPAMNQTLKLELLDTAGAVLKTFDAGTDALGAWGIDERGDPVTNAAVSVRVTSSNGTVQIQALTIR